MQDLTPRLRTRLGKLEHAVGWFVALATLLMLAGFVYYGWHTAKDKGWFLKKATYFTYLDSGVGLNVGDKVKLMGFPAGQITRITPESPEKPYNVYIEFDIVEDNYGYIWSDSRILVKSSSFLGARYLEITKGDGSGMTPGVKATVIEKNGKITEILNPKTGAYEPWTPGKKYFFDTNRVFDPPALGDQMDQMVAAVKTAIPSLLDLTNKLGLVLADTAALVSNVNQIAVEARPVVANLSLITGNLRDPKGSLGEWILPVDLNRNLTTAASNAGTTLTTVNTAVANADAGLSPALANLNKSLENLAGVTGGLNAQVQSNTNILSQISAAVVHADQLVQGLKRHWLLRSAFREETDKKSIPSTNAPPALPGRWRNKP